MLNVCEYCEIVERNIANDRYEEDRAKNFCETVVNNALLKSKSKNIENVICLNAHYYVEDGIICNNYGGYRNENAKVEYVNIYLSNYGFSITYDENFMFPEVKIVPHCLKK